MAKAFIFHGFGGSWYIYILQNWVTHKKQFSYLDISKNTPWWTTLVQTSRRNIHIVVSWKLTDFFAFTKAIVTTEVLLSGKNSSTSLSLVLPEPRLEEIKLSWWFLMVMSDDHQSLSNKNSPLRFWKGCAFTQKRSTLPETNIAYENPYLSW